MAQTMPGRRVPTGVLSVAVGLAGCGALTAAASAGQPRVAAAAFAVPAPAAGSLGDNGDQTAPGGIPAVGGPWATRAAPVGPPRGAGASRTESVAPRTEVVAVTALAAVGDRMPATMPVAGGVMSEQVGTASAVLPAVMLAAYEQAGSTTAAVDPACQLPWALLAGIGKVESDHADGGRVTPAGVAAPPILGPVLDGSAGTAAISAAGGARWAAVGSWARAVGPMQFLPSSWALFGVDGNGDGVADPQNIHDADLTAARYLCAGGRDLGTPAGVAAAVLSYNHSLTYLRAVLAWTAAYTAGVTAAPNPAAPVAPTAPPPSPPSAPPVRSPTARRHPTAIPTPPTPAAPRPLPPLTRTPPSGAPAKPTDPAELNPSRTPPAQPGPTASSRPTTTPTSTASRSPSTTPAPTRPPRPSPTTHPTTRPPTTPTATPTGTPTSTPTPTPDGNGNTDDLPGGHRHPDPAAHADVQSDVVIDAISDTFPVPHPQPMTAAPTLNTAPQGVIRTVRHMVDFRGHLFVGMRSSQAIASPVLCRRSVAHSVDL